MTRPRYSQKSWVECAAHFPKSFPYLRHSIKEGFGLQLAIAQIPKLTHKAYKFKFLLTIQCVSPGGTPLYKLYRYAPPQRVWFLSCFGLKTGIDFETRKKQVTHSITDPAVCSTLRMRTAISPWKWQPWTAVSSLLGLISME